MNTGVSSSASVPLRTAVVDHVLGGLVLEDRLHQRSENIETLSSISSRRVLASA
jgi:hypothetical protein